MYTTEAWVLHEGPPASDEAQEPAKLVREKVTFAELRDNEVLIAPLYGAWEANYTHALARKPLDVCRARGEKSIVLGNCGVVRVLKPGPTAAHVKEGDICVLSGNAVSDRFGYMIGAHAYDAPNTMGIMAKLSKVPERQLIVIPKDGGYELPQWAAFSLRYVTAWSNWRMAYGAWRLQISDHDFPENYHVWGWGGGVAFAELQLAKRFGARCTMIASSAERLRALEHVGIEAFDRRTFEDLQFDDERYERDADYRKRYTTAEKAFAAQVAKRTGGAGVDIFIDNIGEPVFRATLKVLAREGVVATAGWKCGMNLRFLRARECIARHTFVNTHYASHKEVEDSVRYAVEHDWMVPREHLDERFTFDELDVVATKYERELNSYFPIFSINPE